MSASSQLRIGKSLVIAIDGPSGSGKSSVAREIANRLGLAYQDTGAMYRSLALVCLENRVAVQNQAAVEELAKRFYFEQSFDPGIDMVAAGLDFERALDVTDEIREPQVSAAVSAVAINLGARTELIRRQRAAIESVRGRMVVEGRDITTVVAPNAEIRLLLTASEEVRLARRGAQLASAGEQQSAEELVQQVLARDAKDATVVDFQRAADGVVTIDSSDLNFEQTVAAVLRLVQESFSVGGTDD
ncbi:cytidylate kinase [Renibacterium salmoninarum ATCC 33209]|uniref:Cytidylate kinase n=1 Tax=Renibacterium salmoninarum (strain ATCC 33209 / DSM 20767 / JCM 11484 / NBRC 15589 / NCIMB 2235) TaxID=288705 RepID=A9WRN3_RENSM|nr:(d)CMP kinase [Renibacterium salmoninarum]ABY24315.1 cytidylate kinase [Renibacterium salmoninarum ATCC 33209]